MKKNEAVVLEVDVSGAELAIKDVGEGIRALKTLAKDKVSKHNSTVIAFYFGTQLEKK